MKRRFVHVGVTCLGLALFHALCPRAGAQSAAISGTVTGPDGTTGLPDIYVVALAWNNAGWWDETRAAWTGADGRYEIGGLAAGTYRVRFIDWAGNYVEEVYDNAADLDSGTNLVVNEGATVSGIDASLAAAAKISGTVTGADGMTGLPSIYVVAYSWDGEYSFWRWQGSTSTDENGNYEIGGLAAGTYRVEFADYWAGNYVGEIYDNAADLDSGTDIVLEAAASAVGINAALEMNAEISGTVIVADGGAPVENAVVNVGGAPVAWTDEQGKYSFRIAAGSYAVYAQGARDSGLVGQWYSGVDWNPHAPVDVPPTNASFIAAASGAAVSNVDFALQSGARIRGLVADSNGVAIASALIETVNLADGTIATGVSDDSGAYSVERLFPGSYRIRCGAVGYLGQWWELAASASEADLVDLNFGQVLNADFSLATDPNLTRIPTDGEYAWDQSLAWGDYEGDGRLDLAVTGTSWDPDQNSTRWVATVYRSQADGAYEGTELGLDLSGISGATLAWGDYDGNGRLDVAVAGRGWDSAQNATEPLTKIYRNDGNDAFTDIQAGLAGVENAALTWGDYNGNGRLDLAVAGYSWDLNHNATGPVTKIYRNDGNDTFTDIPVELIGVENPSLAWGDYDGNGRLDLAVAGYGRLAGQNATAPVTRVYRNDGNDAFTAIADQFIGVDKFGEHDVSLAWGDDNGDGKLDLALAGRGLELGQNVTAPLVRIYRNQGNDVFAGIPGVLDMDQLEPGAMAWGDFNGNGRPDLALSGTRYDWTQNATISETRLYRNDGNGVFTDIQANIICLSSPLLAWGDSAGQGLSDLAMMGRDSAGQTQIVIYRNNWDDSDNDGLPDWWEEEYYGGPTNAAPDQVPDESGLSNLQKYVADLVPGDGSSIFVFSEVALADPGIENGVITIRWPTAAGRVYRVYVNDDLTAPWPAVPAYTVVGDGQMAVYTHVGADSGPLYFKLTVDLAEK